MLQLLQHLGNGKTLLVDAPAAGPRLGNLLIQTSHSLVSAGTERMLVDFGKAGWIGKARQQPEKVRAVIGKIRADGPVATLNAVRAKLNQPIPLGYCQVGVVVGDTVNSELVAAGAAVSGESRVVNCPSGSKIPNHRSPVTDTQPQLTNNNLSTDAFRVGDRVVSNGPHAEVVSVAEGMCAKIPDGVADEDATFTPLASIALEGISLLEVRAGDRVVVTGLGLIGQLAVRILQAKGCEVMGLDPSGERRGLAELHGAKTVGVDKDPVTAALSWTNGVGVSGVLITASASSNEIVNQAARSCRRRGKVVLVGVVGLQLNRADFYQNEISFQVSCSYGARNPRLDGSARDNFRQVLDWMAAGELKVHDLITHRFDLRAAIEAYGKLADRTALGIVMSYSGKQSEANPPGLLGRTKTFGLEDNQAEVSVAVIGAGNFAMRTLLPELTKLAAPPEISAIVSSQGISALLAAQSFGAKQATTDGDSVLRDSTVDAVFLTTRHDTHAELSLDALAAEKHVWVEKPLCLTHDELDAMSCELGAKSQGKDVGSELIVESSSSLTKAAENTEQIRGDQGTKNKEPRTASAKPVLMVGFNRRFAPMAVKLRDTIGAMSGVCDLKIKVNAGCLPSNHWILDPKMGGGRILGEACHFVDLSRFLIGYPIVDAICERRDSDGQDGGKFRLSFENGSSATIDYRTDLPSHIPKEHIQVSGSGFTAEILNWAKLRSSGMGGLAIGGRWNRAPKKGHNEALTAFLRAINTGVPPIPYAEIFEVSRTAILLQAMREGEQCVIADESSGD